MKKIAYYFVLCLVIYSCSGETNNQDRTGNDWLKYKLKERVKSIYQSVDDKEFMKLEFNQNGKLVRHELKIIYPSNQYYDTIYNDDGKLLETHKAVANYWSNFKSDTFSTYHHYDENGHLTRKVGTVNGFYEYCIYYDNDLEGNPVHIRKQPLSPHEESLNYITKYNYIHHEFYQYNESGMPILHLDYTSYFLGLIIQPYRKTTFTYNSDNKIIEEAVYNEFNTIHSKRYYNYNKKGSLIFAYTVEIDDRADSLKWNRSTPLWDKDTSERWEYKYDHSGRLIEKKGFSIRNESTYLGASAPHAMRYVGDNGTYTYGKDGILIKHTPLPTYYNGNWEEPVTTEYFYDSLGFMTGFKRYYDSNVTITDQIDQYEYRYTFDAAGNWIEQLKIEGNIISKTTRRFEYY